jgi:hypothetical protein
VLTGRELMSRWIREKGLGFRVQGLRRTVVFTGRESDELAQKLPDSSSRGLDNHAPGLGFRA